jgi:hypothetical protein
MAIAGFLACFAVKWWFSRHVSPKRVKAPAAEDDFHDDLGPIGWMRRWSYLDLCGAAFVAGFGTFMTYPILHMITMVLFEQSIIEYAPSLMKWEVLAFLACVGVKFGMNRRDRAGLRRRQPRAA